MKSVYKIALLALTGITVSSCFNDKKPNYQYMPNMYESVGYETYSESDAFQRGGVEAQLPPKGTIKRGFEVYEYENTTAGYDLAKANSKSPLDSLAYNEEKAKELYTIYCGICHGDKGDGKGKLVKNEKFLGVPDYKTRVITEGSIFHVETYGLNAMGSYANQVNQKERWMIAKYVMKLKAE
jgi:mono/diheme cytochrome c family protein